MSKGLLGTLYWYLEVNITTTSTNQISQPDSRQILRHQYGISVAESQTFLLAKHPQRRGTRKELGLISQIAARNLAGLIMTKNYTRIIFNITLAHCKD